MSAPQSAAIYCRISQDREGAMLGVQRQETLCMQLAGRYGWAVGEVYVDDDRSAYAGKSRPAYERMLSDIRAGVRDGVVVVDTDRLTRHPAELEAFIDLAEQMAVPVANATGDLDLSTSDGRFRARIMGVVARQESEKKSERIKRQREQLAQQGKPHPSARPFGYELRCEGLREPEATMIQDAAGQVLAGRSLRSVADEWNASGVLTMRGNRWTIRSVRDVLTRPLNASLRLHRGQVVGEGAWPALFDRDTHERLVAMCTRRKRPGRPPQKLLSSLAVCGSCGQTIVAASGKDKPLYACRRVPGQRDDACGSVAIVAERTEVEVREQVLAVLDRGALNEAIANAQGRKDGDAEALRVDEERLEQLVADYADGTISRREWLVARDRLQRRIDATRCRIEASSSNPVLSTLPLGDQALREWWSAAELGSRRAVLEAIVERVQIMPADRSKPRSRFDPERVQIAWRI